MICLLILPDGFLVFCIQGVKVSEFLPESDTFYESVYHLISVRIFISRLTIYPRASSWPLAVNEGGLDGYYSKNGRIIRAGVRI